MERTRNHWTVQLATHTGNVVDEHVEAFWSPEHEGTTEAVGVAGMVQAWMREHKPTEKARQSFEPIAVTLDE